MDLPLNKDELLNLKCKVEEFARVCSMIDSLGRVYAWLDLVVSIDKVIAEEGIHGFEFPSPHNPMFKENKDV